MDHGLVSVPSGPQHGATLGSRAAQTNDGFSPHRSTAWPLRSKPITTKTAEEWQSRLKLTSRRSHQAPTMSERVIYDLGLVRISPFNPAEEMRILIDRARRANELRALSGNSGSRSLPRACRGTRTPGK